MSYERPKPYWVEHIVVPAKGLVKVKLSQPVSQSLRKTFNMFGYVSFSVIPGQIAEGLPWMTGKIVPQIKLICWHYVDDNKKIPYSSKVSRALAFKKKRG